ncbi:MAG: class I SAM-dependent methyltransferase [Candidatus Margulisbacteria bacterium]|nr:class I SAM-dependent methyltransferase [Candidatus Margulisiibacteriota bacterium]
MKNICPLCKASKTELFHSIKEKEFLKCSVCELVFLKEQHRLSAEQEKERYDLHENDPNDQDYRSFLNKLISPMLKLIKKSDTGLDYGCGPGPTLSIMLEEKGYDVEHYDPIYFANDKLLARKYDFITCSEVVEHFYEPHAEFLKLKNMLKPQGFLGVMTNVMDEKVKFSEWHYPKDPTHVGFYSNKTFKWIEKEFGFNVIRARDNVVIYQLS